MTEKGPPQKNNPKKTHQANVVCAQRVYHQQGALMRTEGD